ncbi:UDP-galactose transporter [Tulasnella sp. JGI-2019a]|nr:UDP-galactose transporter [Tulasnella sp. JGI-2019a]KAG9010192.1 UDP-galactose transporter [Tulasnella sp. JGI-2019a]
MFLLWAIAQERLSVPFMSTITGKPEKFKSVLFLNTAQSAASALSSLVYILCTRKKGESLKHSLGLELSIISHKAAHANGATNGHANGSANGTTNGVAANGNGHAKEKHPAPPSASPRPLTANMRQQLFLRYLQCSISITTAAPFGFASLSHISYPTMVLGKSCKLVPVMLMNVLLYRRKFAAHKYLVVAMVTAGITMFMAFGERKGSGKGVAQSSIWGLFLLVVNLLIDGATNSTQDEIFTKYKVTGQQMMFWINTTSTVVTTILLCTPLPYIPTIHPGHNWEQEILQSMDYIRTHPSVIRPLVEFALTGGLGQLFIFETLQHFGSLTLVTITLTRKLFTMLLSVIVYHHSLTLGQWAGAAVVFAGISVEAYVKRKDVHAKRVLQEKEKAKIKDL